jgi:hypothetical protein
VLRVQVVGLAELAQGHPFFPLAGPLALLALLSSLGSVRVLSRAVHFRSFD